MESVAQPCPVCDTGTAYPHSFFTPVNLPAATGVIACKNLHCDHCESFISGAAELQANKYSAVKLRTDIESYATTGTLPEDMLRCWSCKAFVYKDHRAENDGHCPACQCEIEI